MKVKHKVQKEKVFGENFSVCAEGGLAQHHPDLGGRGWSFEKYDEAKHGTGLHKLCYPFGRAEGSCDAEHEFNAEHDVGFYKGAKVKNPSAATAASPMPPTVWVCAKVVSAAVCEQLRLPAQRLIH